MANESRSEQLANRPEFITGEDILDISGRIHIDVWTNTANGPTIGKWSLWVERVLNG